MLPDFLQLSTSAAMSLVGLVSHDMSVLDLASLCMMLLLLFCCLSAWFCCRCCFGRSEMSLEQHRGHWRAFYWRRTPARDAIKQRHVTACRYKARTFEMVHSSKCRFCVRPNVPLQRHYGQWRTFFCSTARGARKRVLTCWYEDWDAP